MLYYFIKPYFGQIWTVINHHPPPPPPPISLTLCAWGHTAGPVGTIYHRPHIVGSHSRWCSLCSVCYSLLCSTVDLLHRAQGCRG